MKYCSTCGVPLKDNDRFCSDCGTAYSAGIGDPLQILEDDCANPGEKTIENIERRVANYYNDTYLGTEQAGKYVVLHSETTVSADVCNVVVRYQDNEESNNSDAGTLIAEVSVNMITGECTVQSQTVQKVKKTKTGAQKFISVIAVILLLNIILVPFIGDIDGLFTENPYVHSFWDMIDQFPSNDDMPIDVVYYVGGAICALFIFISAWRRNSLACTIGTIAGIILLGYIGYLFFSGTRYWYIGISDAYLTLGYYISCAGFLAIFIALLCEKKE